MELRNEDAGEAERGLLKLGLHIMKVPYRKCGVTHMGFYSSKYAHGRGKLQHLLMFMGPWGGVWLATVEIRMLENQPLD